MERNVRSPDRWSQPERTAGIYPLPRYLLIVPNTGFGIFGQTHDIKNLFISDGSQFTTGGAENPTLTIVTLAIRQADYIAEQMTAGAI